MPYKRAWAAIVAGIVAWLGVAPALQPGAVNGTGYAVTTARPATVGDPMVLRPELWAPVLARGVAQRLAPLAQTTPLQIVLTLAPRDPAGLAALAQAVSDPQNPRYRHYLSPAAIAQRFAPASTAAPQVVAWLQTHGITTVAAGTGVVAFRADAGAVGALFATHLAAWRLPDGRAVYGPDRAPALPAALTPLITSVQGLDNTTRLHPLHRLRALAWPRAARNGGYTPPDLVAAYNIGALHSAGFSGRGQTIDLYELDGYNPQNINAFTTTYGLTTGPVVPYLCQGNSGGTVTCAAGSALTPSGSDGQVEVESDIEVIQEIAPQATIHVYEMDQTGVYNTLDGLWRAMVTAHDAAIISTSWGDCEQNQGSLPASTDPILQRAALTGIGIYAAAGDTGSYDCLRDTGTASQNSRAIDWPGDDPYVTSVGGTTLQMDASYSAYAGETVWNNGAPSGGSGGGGASLDFARPTYQSGVAAPGLGSTAALSRTVPDVAADSDPNTGYRIYTLGSWQEVAGTSLATPLWAALMALANQGDGCAAPVGFANPTLYALAQGSTTASVFHDVTSGNNDYLSITATSPLYPAAVGYDLASGWGSPNGAALVSALAAPCAQAQTATAQAGQTATAAAQASATAQAGQTAATAAAATVAAGQTATVAAQASATMVAGQTATAAAGQTATVAAQASATAQAGQTATAAAQASATASTYQSATAQAGQTATAAAQASATAVAQASATAAAAQTATAVAQATGLAIAAQTATIVAGQTATASAGQRATAVTQTAIPDTATVTPTAAAPNPTARPTRPSPPSLTVSLIHAVVATGGVLTGTVRVAPASLIVHVNLQVTTTRTIVIGNGPQRHRIQQHVVLYRFHVSGKADRHGLYHLSLHVAYRPRSAARALLTVTAGAIHFQASRVLPITILPTAQRRPATPHPAATHTHR